MKVKKIAIFLLSPYHMVKILNLPPPNLVWDGRDSYPALPYTIFKKVFCRNGGYEHLLGKTSTLMDRLMDRQIHRHDLCVAASKNHCF